MPGKAIERETDVICVASGGIVDPGNHAIHKLLLEPHLRIRSSAQLSWPKLSPPASPVPGGVMPELTAAPSDLSIDIGVKILFGVEAKLNLSEALRRLVGGGGC